MRLRNFTASALAFFQSPKHQNPLRSPHSLQVSLSNDERSDFWIDEVNYSISRRRLQRKSSAISHARTDEVTIAT